MFSLTTISMLIWHAVNADMVVFIPFASLVATSPSTFIIELNLILYNIVTSNMWLFTNIKYNTNCQFLWWSSSSLGSGTRGTLCICCGIFRTISFLRWRILIHIIWINTCSFRRWWLWCLLFGCWQRCFNSLAWNVI